MQDVPVGDVLVVVERLTPPTAQRALEEGVERFTSRAAVDRLYQRLGLFDEIADDHAARVRKQATLVVEVGSLVERNMQLAE
jgi:hypothetical protein